MCIAEYKDLTCFKVQLSDLLEYSQGREAILLDASSAGATDDPLEYQSILEPVKSQDLVPIGWSIFIGWSMRCQWGAQTLFIVTLPGILGSRSHFHPCIPPC